MDPVKVNNWKGELPGIIEGYAVSDIYNCDETGLLWKQTTNKSLVMQSNHAPATKKDKSRVTLQLCTSWVGRKERVLFIAKIQKPKALKGCVIYKIQRKSWMTGFIFGKRRQNESRKVLLFLDDVCVHKVIRHDLTNTKLVFLPQSTTGMSFTKPSDVGIIQALKLNYRKQLHSHILGKIMDDNAEPKTLIHLST